MKRAYGILLQLGSPQVPLSDSRLERLDVDIHMQSRLILAHIGSYFTMFVTFFFSLESEKTTPF